MFKLLYNLLLLLIIFFNKIIYPEGFLPGTFIQTSSGLEKIEDLKVRQKVLATDLKNNISEKEIISIRTEAASNYLKIIINQTLVYCSQNQKFYLVNSNKWIMAKNLKVADLIKTANGLAQVNQIELLEEKTKVILLTVKDFKNFFISDEQILTHNWSIAIPFLIEFGGGAIEVCWAAIAGGILGKATDKFLTKITSKRKRQNKFKEQDLEELMCPKCGTLICGHAEKQIIKHNNKFDNILVTPIEIPKLPNKYIYPITEDINKTQISNHPINPSISKPIILSSPTIQVIKPNILSIPKFEPENHYFVLNSANNNDKPQTKPNENIEATPKANDDKWTKLKGNQGWKDEHGNFWNKDKLHKDHWDVSDRKGKKIKEVDFKGKIIWPNGTKNKNKGV